MSESLNHKNYSQYIRFKVLVLVVLLTLLIFLALADLALGSAGLSLADVGKAVFGQGDRKVVTIVQKMRLPRVATALVAGFGLAAVGCVMQSILRNPMADASTLGVSPGAAFGAAFAIVVLNSGIQSPSDASVSFANPFTLSLCAFVCSMIPTVVILSLSRLQRVKPESMILTGVALATLFSGGTAIIQYFATTTQLGSIVFWTFGSLTSTTMREVWIMAAVTAAAFVFFFLNRWNYTALLSGESAAKALGVNTDALVIGSMIVCSLTAAVTTAFIGILNFIGLIAPHIVRRIIGNDYRFLLPASALAGTCLLLLSDLLSRMILAPQVLPIGAITSFVGAPVFIYLINRDRISLSAEEGRFLALLGNNGAGKSTLLKCLNGILPVDAGVVFADGEDLKSMKRRRIAQTMAYVEQSNEVSRLTVYDVVLMGRKPYITVGPTEKDIAIVERALDRLQLRPFALRYVDELSGGELQKVIIARAVAQCPKILLLDEPTSNLDLFNQHEVMSIAQELAEKDGLTVIVVIHDLNLALRYCDRFLFLKNGRIHSYGDSGVVTEETIREIYQVNARIFQLDGRKIVVI